MDENKRKLNKMREKWGIFLFLIFIGVKILLFILGLDILEKRENMLKLEKY